VSRLFIDAGEQSGSGTIIRYSSVLGVLLGREVELKNIRAKRKKPGLRAQHLTALKAVAELCGGSLQTGGVGDTGALLTPGNKISGGKYTWEIGTAGSANMLVLNILPLALFADSPVEARIVGGTFQDFAPSAYHLIRVLFPLLHKMGARLKLKLKKPGYVPIGGGELVFSCKPLSHNLKPFQMLSPGFVEKITGIALSSHLQSSKVSSRMARACSKEMEKWGYEADIEEIYDQTANQPGAVLAIRTETQKGALLGIDMAGKPGRRAEDIGRSVARMMVEDLRSGATVDRFTADQLIIFAALAGGESIFRIPGLTEHVSTNLWLIEKILGTESRLEENLVTIKGVELSPSRRQEND